MDCGQPSVCVTPEIWGQFERSVACYGLKYEVIPKWALHNSVGQLCGSSQKPALDGAGSTRILCSASKEWVRQGAAHLGDCRYLAVDLTRNNGQFTRKPWLEEDEEAPSSAKAEQRNQS